MTQTRPPRNKAADPGIRGSTYDIAMKPQRRLLIVLGGLLAVWVGWLLLLYFTTVYPQRHGGAHPTPPADAPVRSD